MRRTHWRTPDDELCPHPCMDARAPSERTECKLSDVSNHFAVTVTAVDALHCAAVSCHVIRPTGVLCAIGTTEWIRHHHRHQQQQQHRRRRRRHNQLPQIQKRRWIPRLIRQSQSRVASVMKQKTCIYGPRVRTNAQSVRRATAKTLKQPMVVGDSTSSARCARVNYPRHGVWKPYYHGMMGLAPSRASRS